MSPGVRTSADIEEDSRRLDALSEIMPLESVREAVSRCFQAIKPEEISRLADKIDVKLGLGPDTEAIEGALRQSFIRLESCGYPEETRTARREMVKFWITGILRMWRAFGKHAPEVILDGKLCSDAGSNQAFAFELETLRQSAARSKEALLGSATILEADLEPLKERFTESLHTKLRAEGVVELPDGVNIYGRDNRFVLRGR